MVEHLPGIYEALGSILSTEKERWKGGRQKKKEKKERERQKERKNSKFSTSIVHITVC
jgi:hypothetical protein